jgi:hypothetical protein
MACTTPGWQARFKAMSSIFYLDLIIKLVHACGINNTHVHSIYYQYVKELPPTPKASVGKFPANRQEKIKFQIPMTKHSA